VKSGTVSSRDRLTERQRLFAMAYVADPKRSAINAAVKAGCSRKTAYVTGSKWLRLPKIRWLIQSFLDKQMVKFEVSADRVIQEFACIGFSNMLDYLRVSKDGLPIVDLRQITRQQGTAIQEVSVEGKGKNRRIKIRLHSKTTALQKLGEYLKLFDKDELKPEELRSILVVDVPRPARPELPAPEKS
jgi:phage terminase small subunit